MSIEANLERGWAHCAACGIRAPEATLEQDSATTEERLICRDRRWCAEKQAGLREGGPAAAHKKRRKRR